MSWKKQLTPDDNEIYIGQKPPIYYGFSIASLIKKFGECIVIFEPEKSYVFNGQKRTMNMQWDDVFRFISDGFNCKILKEKTEINKRTIIVTW